MGETRETVRLEYATGTVAPVRRPWWLAWGTVGVALVAVSICFIPLADIGSGVTPWMLSRAIGEAIDFDPAGLSILVLIALSFMTAIPTALWKVLQLWRRRPGKWECGVALVVAIVCALPLGATVALVAYRVFMDLREGGEHKVWISAMLLLVLTIQIVGMLLAVRLWRGKQRAVAVDVLMMSPFLGNAAICLIAFSDEQYLGWWLTLFVGIAWLAEWGILWWLARRCGTGIAT